MQGMIPALETKAAITVMIMSVKEMLFLTHYVGKGNAVFNTLEMPYALSEREYCTNSTR